MTWADVFERSFQNIDTFTNMMRWWASGGAAGAVALATFVWAALMRCRR